MMMAFSPPSIQQARSVEQLFLIICNIFSSVYSTRGGGKPDEGLVNLTRSMCAVNTSS